MAERAWTNEQAQAIEARGGALLVSAAAGSGKTAVLVERVIRRITGDGACDADRLLVVTFTNAAAAEMRERIALRVAALLSQSPGDAQLRRQQVLLQNARICTIDSFCIDLVRSHFEKLNIPPDFRIGDENELRVLRSDLLAEILEERYAQGLAAVPGNAFLALAGMLGGGRDDTLLEETVFRLFDFLSSLPDPEGWLSEKRELMRCPGPVAESIWGRAALEYAEASLAAAAQAHERSLAEIREYDELVKTYAPAFEEDLGQLKTALEAARRRNWDVLYAAVSGFSFARLGSPRKFEPAEVKEALKERRDALKERIAGLQKGLLCCDEEGFNSDLAALLPVTEALFGVVSELDRRFFERKLARSVLDFADIERLALRLLCENGRPTAEAEAVAGRFEEVLVDEYQDINPTQNAIFEMVSGGGRRLFMVGDVKQSIYRFRKATPELFIEKSENFADYDGTRFPARITLGKNFRSRAGVTSGVNFVFSQLMSKKFGEMEYGRREALVPGAQYPPRDGADFELHVVDTSENDGDARDILEARYIAGVIGRMVAEGFTVQGEEGPRKATWRDFCILLRSTSGRAEKFQRELSLAGIPTYAEVAGGYLGSYEVAVLLSLLRVLDNPLQDVPLLSAMLSPVFGFTPDDLARIRIESRSGGLYQGLCGYAKGHGGRFAEFLSLIGSLRTLAAVLPADRLILRIFEQTSFLQICEAMPGGEGRRANLRLLLEYARTYEAAGYKGLAGFLRFIDRVGEQAGDLAPGSAVSENADVVRIMSIHKSKGLEFPVCILANTTGRFNREDSQRPALFHPEFGFGCIVRDEKLAARFMTLPREAVRLAIDRSALSEEMRVLYVAMTRAREKLICVASMKKPEAALKKAAACIRPGETRLDPLELSQADSFADWLLACALRHPDAAKLRGLAGLKDLLSLPCDARLAVVTAGAAGAAEPDADGQSRTEPAVDPSMLAEIEQRLAFAYPTAFSKIPAKVAVSELAREQSGESEQEPLTAFFADGGLTPAQRGTALHAFMQYADLAGLKTEEDIRAQTQRLVDGRFILPEQGASVEPEKVLAFLNSPIAERMRGAKKIYREFRFNIRAGEEDTFAGIPLGEGAVLQGMADIVFEEEDGYVLVDYKTDRAGAEELRQRYAGQLAVYARAVTEIFRRPVTAKVLYSFHTGRAVEV